MNVVKLYGGPSGGAKMQVALALVELDGTNTTVASATEKWVTNLRIIGAKALSASAVPTANTATILYGYNDGAASPTHTFRGQVPVYSATTDPGVLIEASVGQRINLQHVSLKAGTSGDKAVLEYLEEIN